MAPAREKEWHMERILENFPGATPNTVKPKLHAETAENCLKWDRNSGAEGIIIISIMGAMRIGKSFAVCLFCLYLKFREENPHGNFEQFLELDIQIKGVHYKQDNNAVTKGICLLNKPFIITQGQKKVAVSIVDSQGLFDREKDFATNDAINIACMLDFSTLPILNVQKHSKGTDLQSLVNSFPWVEDGELDSFQILHRDWDAKDEKDYGLQPVIKIGERSEMEQNVFRKFKEVEEWRTPLPHITIRAASESTGVSLKSLVKRDENKAMLSSLMKHFDHVLNKCMHKKYWKSPEQAMLVIERWSGICRTDILAYQSPAEANWTIKIRKTYEDKISDIEELFDKIDLKWIDKQQLNEKLKEVERQSREMVEECVQASENISQDLANQVREDIISSLEKRLKRNKKLQRNAFEQVEKRQQSWMNKIIVGVFGAMTILVGLTLGPIVALYTAMAFGHLVIWTNLMGWFKTALCRSFRLTNQLTVHIWVNVAGLGRRTADRLVELIQR